MDVTLKALLFKSPHGLLNVTLLCLKLPSSHTTTSSANRLAFDDMVVALALLSGLGFCHTELRVSYPSLGQMHVVSLVSPTCQHELHVT